MEGTSWGGGAFAKVVVEALPGRAASRGVVAVWGMLDYVDRRVIELIQGLQHPVVKMPRNSSNFPMAAVGELGFV